MAARRGLGTLSLALVAAQFFHSGESWDNGLALTPPKVRPQNILKIARRSGSFCSQGDFGCALGLHEQILAVDTGGP